MRFIDNSFVFSPSDLITYMESPFASHMERCKTMNFDVIDLMDPIDPLIKSLQDRGYAHEDAFLKQLSQSNLTISKVKHGTIMDMYSQTTALMSEGIDIIVQGYLKKGNFGGFADFIVKVDGDSELGSFHYQVWDTKLSKKMKPYFAVQLCCYSEMIKNIQGIYPHEFTIILGNNQKVALALSEYFSYYKELKKAFLNFHENWDKSKLPDPGEFTSNGRWNNYANDILKNNRHLRLTANIRQSQISHLKNANINTIDQLASTKNQKVKGINTEVLLRLKSQAQLQVSSETADTPLYKILPHDPNKKLGLNALPPSSESDIFFDIEGFPLIEGGLEYLWGATYFDEKKTRKFKDFWAHEAEQEIKAFSDFIDWSYNRWLTDPTMHIYHYAPYEIVAIKRLMGRYAIKETEVDTLLRNGVFIDLYKIIRHGLLIGEQSYSIKNIEKLYRSSRKTHVSSGGDSVVTYEKWRNNPDSHSWKTSTALKAIRDYNQDDCESTQELTDWLRRKQVKHEIDFVKTPPVETKNPTEVTIATNEIQTRLDDFNKSENTLSKNLQQNLTWLLDFHQRENKPTWWRLFDRLDSTEMELYDDMDCLSYLMRTEAPSFLPSLRSRNKVYEYAFDKNQPFKGTAKSFHVLNQENMKITARDISIDKGIALLSYKDIPPSRISLVPDEFINPAAITAALRLAVNNLIVSSFGDCAILDFLKRLPPRFTNGTRNPIVPEVQTNDEFLRSVTKAAVDLDNSYLCIQGPPGTGKSYTASRIIGTLLNNGHRVGISSNSHKAITNLMYSVSIFLSENDIEAELYKFGGDKDDPIFLQDNVFYKASVKDLINTIDKPSSCFGGTAWQFCNPVFSERKMSDKLDYLFIDEAGQVPVANFVAMSGSARNLVVMGDQMQLDNPTKGTHPEDSGKSILQYLLQDNATVPKNIGVFLPKTFRMHPKVCEIISSYVYEGRLNADQSTSKYVLGTTKEGFSLQPGVHFVSVPHKFNSQGSFEEVQSIKNFTEKVIDMPFWPDSNNNIERKISWSDILIVAPYNYQVNLLKSALNIKARIGTVDKFQGQEAPIVLLSMCSSDPSESPRGLEFLFSKNRLNVAISRAQSVSIVFASPKLISAPVNSLKQMALINFFVKITGSKISF